MPRIPDDMAAFGGGPSLQPRRGIVQGPSDEGMTEAKASLIAEIGNSIDKIGEIGREIKERESKINLAHAKSEYLAEIIKIDSQFENDNDFQTMGTRYTEQTEKARNAAAEKITDPNLRESFILGANVDLAKGLANIQKKAFVKEADHGRANLTTLLDNSQKLILSTRDPNIRKSAYENVNSSIDAAVKNNYLDETAGVNLKRKFAEESAIGEFASRSPEERLKMIKEKHPALQFVPADKLQAIEEHSAAAVASNTFLQERLEKLQRADDARNLLNILEQSNGAIEKIPTKIFMNLDVEQRKKIREYAKALENGTYNATDMTRYHDLRNMAENPTTREAFLEMDLTTDIKDFSLEHRLKMIDLQAKLRNKDPETEKMLDGYRTVGQRLNDTLIQAGINTKPAGGSDDAKSLALLRDRVERSIIKEKERQGKKELTAEDEQRIIDRELIKEKTPGWFGTGLGAGERYTFQATIDDVSDEDRAKIESALRAKGQQVNDANILKLYTEKLKRDAIKNK